MVYKLLLFVDENHFFMIVFNREAPIEENTSSECIVIIAAMYGCKIFQLHKYEANEYGYKGTAE